jgi:hypothetical protein
MQKIFILCLLALSTSLAFGQGGDTTVAGQWKESILKEAGIARSDTLAELLDYDLSDLLKTDAIDPPLGFIGSNYQRFNIFFTSVKKDSTKKNVYIVTGKSKVKSNICDFKGTITLTDVGYYAPKSDNCIHPDSLKLGVVISKYKFPEDPNQKHVGTLEGYMAMGFYITPNHKIFYDDLNVAQDNYYNNQYVGTWASYDGKTTDPCNWGNSRIPACGDLDEGKKDFMPAEKYKANGWDMYPSLLNTIWWK